MRAAVERRVHPDPDRARSPGCGVASVVERALKLAVGRDQRGAQLLADRGQRDLAAGAIKQLRSDARFEHSDRLAHARVGDPEPLGGASEVKLLGEREEYADLAQLNPGPHR